MRLYYHKDHQRQITLQPRHKAVRLALPGDSGRKLDKIGLATSYLTRSIEDAGAGSAGVDTHRRAGSQAHQTCACATTLVQWMSVAAMDVNFGPRSTGS